MKCTALAYRDRIYGRYATHVQRVGSRFDHAAAERWGEPYREYLKGWLPIDPNAAILDAACGGGKFLHFLRQRGYRNVTGVDVSPEQVALARQLQADVLEEDIVLFLRRHRGRFDCLIALDLIEHFSKEEVFEFLDAAREALRPGGRMIVQTPNGISPTVCSPRYADFTHEICFTPESLRSVLHICGFVNTESRECPPIVRGPKSALRSVGWRLIRLTRTLSSYVETGGPGAGVWTRVFVMSAIRQPE